MEKYVKPVVVVNEDYAEGVYAASGDGDCWSVWVKGEQDWTGPDSGNHIFEIAASHSTDVTHISSATTIVVTFSSNITNAYAENGTDYSVSFSGNTAYITRTLLADAYHDGDEVTYKIFVSTGDEATTKALAVTGLTISCEKTVNVQGGID